MPHLSVGSDKISKLGKFKLMIFYSPFNTWLTSYLAFLKKQNLICQELHMLLTFNKYQRR